MNVTPRVFVSFDFDNDKTTKDLFVGQCKNDKTPFEYSDWSAKEKMPQSEWEKIVKEKINKCHALLVLVNDHFPNVPGVNKEIAMAVEQDVPVIGVYVGEADENVMLPTGLARCNVKKWTWDNIDSLIEDAMKKGKNKQ